MKNLPYSFLIVLTCPFYLVGILSGIIWTWLVGGFTLTYDINNEMLKDNKSR